MKGSHWNSVTVKPMNSETVNHWDYRCSKAILKVNLKMTATPKGSLTRWVTGSTNATDSMTVTESVIETRWVNAKEKSSGSD